MREDHAKTAEQVLIGETLSAMKPVEEKTMDAEQRIKTPGRNH
jgi:hypothetical protein